MKILILLIVVALVVVGVKWKLRKDAAEAALARRKSMERMKKTETGSPGTGCRGHLACDDPARDGERFGS